MNSIEKQSGKVSVVTALLWIYGIISQICTVYFWWQYAKEDSFISVLTVDVLLAELKGLLWIFFIW